MRTGYKHGHWTNGMEAARDGYAGTILPSATAKQANLIAVGAPDDLLEMWAKGLVMVTELVTEANAILADHAAAGNRVSQQLKKAGGIEGVYDHRDANQT